VEIIAAVIGEQFRDADPSLRRQVEITLRDILGHAPFYGGGVPELAIDNPDPDDLVAKTKVAEEANPGQISLDHAALGVKGGVALVLLGALSREHGASASETPRPYTVLQQMLHDEFGQELLGEAIKALRAGADRIPARDGETRELKGRDAENRVVPMRPDDLRQMFTASPGAGSGSGGGPARTSDDILAEMISLVRNDLGDRLGELTSLPEVAHDGIAPHKVDALVDLLMGQAGDLDYLGRKGGDRLRASEEAVVEVGEVG
jgi:hypothetical protein